MKIRDYLKEEKSGATWTGMGDEAGNSYPDDGSGIASDDDRPPGNILMAPRYQRQPYYNKLTSYNSIWKHDDSGNWYWDWFENATGQDDIENYHDSLETMKDLFPGDTWDAAWSPVRKREIPDKEQDRRFDVKGQPYRDSDDVLSKEDDDESIEPPKELDADTKGVSEMNLIKRIDVLLTDNWGIGQTGQDRDKVSAGQVGGDIKSSEIGSNFMPSEQPPAESAANSSRPKVKRKKKRKKVVVVESKVSDTILKQINAIDKWALQSWGAKNYVASNDGIQFDVKGSKFRGRVILTYDKSSDTYIIELGNVRKLDWKQKRVIKPVFAGDLVNVLDQQIG